MNTQNSSGMMNGLPPLSKPERKIGPIVGALIIVLVLIIAALYIFGKNLNTEPEIVAPEVRTTETMATSTSATSTTSDDTTSLESDLDAQLEDVDYSF